MSRAITQLPITTNTTMTIITSPPPVHHSRTNATKTNHHPRTYYHQYQTLLPIYIIYPISSNHNSTFISRHALQSDNLCVLSYSNKTVWLVKPIQVCTESHTRQSTPWCFHANRARNSLSKLISLFLTENRNIHFINFNEQYLNFILN